MVAWVPITPICPVRVVATARRTAGRFTSTTGTTPAGMPQFTAALKANNVETSDFEPMTFKQAAPAAKTDSPATTPSAPGYGQSALLGGTIDIRV